MKLTVQVIRSLLQGVLRAGAIVHIRIARWGIVAALRPVVQGLDREEASLNGSCGTALELTSVLIVPTAPL
jgi:hypothetical protein